MMTFADLKLAISPCPNDTYIFESFINETGVNAKFFDIEALNDLAIGDDYDIIKVSYALLPQIDNKYQLLSSGSALGYGAGPLLVAKKEFARNELDNLVIGIPGENTTANLLLKNYAPKVLTKSYIFSELINKVLEKEIDAALIIHETRFTYQNFGLKKIVDLGEWLEQKTGLPVPLGAIVAKKSLGETKIAEIEKLIKESILAANSRLDKITPFISSHAQELDQDTMRKHIALYVNDFSLDLGKKGREAIEQLLTPPLR